MDQGTAAILGALAGAVGAIGVAFIDRWARKNEREAEGKEELVMQRKDAYVDLLTAARELRFVALRTFHGTQDRSPSDIDAMRTNISRANYVISLLASREIAAAAESLRDSVIHLWRYSRDNPGATKEERGPRVHEARAASDSFRALVRSELNIAPDALPDEAEE